MGASRNGDTSIAGWFIVEDPTKITKMDDLGSPKKGNTHMVNEFKSRFRGIKSQGSNPKSHFCQ
jgi:hypothetical protein